MCNCSVVDAILSAVIVVFAFWPTSNLSKWVIVIAGLIIFVHALVHKHSYRMDKMPAKPAEKAKRK